MKRQQIGLYNQYRKFQSQKASMKKKRDAKLKKILKSASMDNFFQNDEENVGNNKTNAQIELSENGISLKGSAEEERMKLMGMSNIKDLKHLDINKKISRRLREVQKPEDNHEEVRFNSYRKTKFSNSKRSTKINIKNIKISFGKL